MNINELAKRCHEDAKTLGWYDAEKTKSDVEGLMMVVTEIAEAVEELRNPEVIIETFAPKSRKPLGYGVELADTIIRLLDLCAYREIDIEGIINRKLDYNLTRGTRHGNKEF